MLCGTSPPLTIYLTNILDIVRQNETVEITIDNLLEEMASMINRVGVYNPSEVVFLTTQRIDLDQD
tara:strand:- start:155 stop:352 length:198 start_codon:yes stop_codon:yes gene_type:complete